LKNKLIKEYSISDDIKGSRKCFEIGSN